MKVNLNNVSDLQKFVNDISHFNYEIIAERGNYKVNAKSIIGLLSLDLSEPLEINILSDNENIISEFKKVGEKYV